VRFAPRYLVSLALMGALAFVLTPVARPRSAEAQPSVGGARYGGSIYGGSRYGGNVAGFARCLEQSVADRIRDGYYVKGYGFIRDVRTAEGSTNPFVDKTRGGRFGEYSEWGAKWIKPCVDRYTPGATIDEIVIEAKATAHKQRVKDYADSIYEATHRATRVVLTDGRRVVVDYWDGIASGRGRMQTQTDWVARWRERIGANAVVSVSADEVALKAAIKRLGEDKGIAQFRKQAKSRKGADPELWITSWKREPW
jgi:hypothetical protein